ncbi:MAG: rRNA maturation RNase YbeY [Candidatus Krumholzibacteria bacterium]|jgi:probable rRNA maturation factor|nr:rRNA maturation RNase YbeY [Candidatus Krumholzibacteria bacterium]MDP6670148.1 rRNA maturation RNase YbeY [Candidatus Krumholzibacteria bacterium]MDP6796512.1 rRNA maturation RNase YbeY [Candidatus Krumholzibacteria bacterium]MDP7021923.1 rRNA maturation RNase YbeY [Candidatus Krumholzibacteria bacterium]
MKLRFHWNQDFSETESGEGIDLDCFSSMAGEIGLPEEIIEISFVSDQEIRKLNREWRKKDSPTDVLSFRYGSSLEEGTGDFAGELILSVETARKQALKEGHSTLEEIAVLLVHGLHHIAGHDHEIPEESNRMAEAEEPFRHRLSRYFRSRKETRS